MLRYDKSAPIWLFSFVDLAFLLLIAFTQIGPEATASDLVIGQIEVPHIHSSATPLAGRQPATLWQLRVHPFASDDPEAVLRTPFELVEPGWDRHEGNGERVLRIDAAELAAHLQLLRERRLKKPILAPHKDSRTEDLLVAVGLLEEVWLSGRGVAVIPHPSVAMAPPTDNPNRK